MDLKEFMIKHREAVLYIFFGCLNVVVTWFSYAALVWMGMELNLSNILSWLCGSLFAFVCNKWIVFSSKSLKATTVVRELGSFFGARIFTGVIAIVLFPILLSLGMNQVFMGTKGFLAKIVTSVIEIGLNWVFNKYMIFNKKAGQ